LRAPRLDSTAYGETVQKVGNQILDSDYRHNFQGKAEAQQYRNMYERGYDAKVWEAIEMPLLERLLQPLGGSDRGCLDFACGTGRISRVAARFFGYVAGVDVSAEMLRQASVPKNVELIHTDITRSPLSQTFDVALAFRFFLNAEPQLRVDALRAIAGHLNVGSRFIFNIHLSDTSPMGLAYRLLNRVPGRQHVNTEGEKSVTALLREHGFDVEAVIWYCFMHRPGRFFPRLVERLIVPAERLAKLLHVPQRMGQSFLVVAAKR
jgi:SAM-dependent methyltransferase